LTSISKTCGFAADVTHGVRRGLGEEAWIRWHDRGATTQGRGGEEIEGGGRSGESMDDVTGNAAIALLAACIRGVDSYVEAVDSYVTSRDLIALSRMGGGKWRVWLALTPFLSRLSPTANWDSQRSRPTGWTTVPTWLRIFRGMMGVVHTGSVLRHLEAALESSEAFERRRQAFKGSHVPERTASPGHPADWERWWKASIKRRLAHFGLLISMPLVPLFFVIYGTVVPLLDLPTTISDVRAQLRERWN
jgi:hypothetical protein